MVAGFKKATKARLFLRLAMCGPAGSGKTWTSLELAMVLAAIAAERGEGNGRVAVIDSERESARLYADQYDFDHCPLDGNYSPQEYIDALKLAREAGYSVVIIDSFSHPWSGEGGILDQKDAMGGSFNAWRKLTPQHNALVDAILTYPGHVICTIRSKQEYVVEEYEDGGKKKQKVTKLGMAPVQRDGVEYEFTITADMNMENTLTISKSRCAKLPPGTIIRKPDGKLARTIDEWLNSNAVAEPVKIPPKLATDEQKATMKTLLKELGIESGQKAYVESLLEGAFPETAEEFERANTELRKRVDARQKAKKTENPPSPAGESAPPAGSIPAESKATDSSLQPAAKASEGAETAGSSSSSAGAETPKEQPSATGSKSDSPSTEMSAPPEKAATTTTTAAPTQADGASTSGPAAMTTQATGPQPSPSDQPKTTDFGLTPAMKSWTAHYVKKIGSTKDVKALETLVDGAKNAKNALSDPARDALALVELRAFNTLSSGEAHFGISDDDKATLAAFESFLVSSTAKRAA